MIETSNCKIMREQVVGSSKLDFLVGNTYIEVKMPLQFLQVDIPDYVKIRKMSQFDSTDHFIKHMNELGKSLKNNERAILLTEISLEIVKIVAKRIRNYAQNRSFDIE